jgi:hypothetical protein
MLRVRRVLEIFLEMNESTRRLNEAFEKIVVIRIGVQPKLLEHIVRLIITLLVPALKKGAIKWMLCDVCLVWIDIFSSQPGHQPRNPLAFVHEGLNLLAAQIMSKPARISFSEEQDCPPRPGEFSQASLAVRP